MSNLKTKTPIFARFRRSGKRKGPARGALWVIALLLSTSGFIRLTGESGQAIARGASQLTGSAEEVPVGDGMSVASQMCPTESDITVVLERLQDREHALEAKEDTVANRMQALAVAEAKVEEGVQALVAAEGKLRATMALADTAAEDDLIRLTAVYENMKAKEAAALFEAMDPQFSAGFLGRMRPDIAASIMAGLTPQTAYTISVILAGRNANVPSE